MTIHAIGDIHGELDKLRDLHARIEARAGRDAQIVHVGDLIDRGPDSRGVVEYLREGQARGRNWMVLRGNHDRFLPRFLENPEWVDPALSHPLTWPVHHGLGAAATLAKLWHLARSDAGPDPCRGPAPRACRTCRMAGRAAFVVSAAAGAFRPCRRAAGGRSGRSGRTGSGLDPARIPGDRR
ncbi:metallophosphoesterase [Paracoccus sp. DMF-8]|uniref:metallophosphoesterase n=1 Tax=Paracoccus sp. DMF-8 TaxID=3019445 RepID=UPI003204E9BA